MYDFLLLEDFWMDVVVIAALIGVGGTIGGTIAGGLFARSRRLDKIKDAQDRIKDGIQGLMSGQEGMGFQHNTLSLEHQQLLGQQVAIKEHLLMGQKDIKEHLKDTANTVHALNNMLIEKKANDENQYRNLDEKQKVMVDSMANLARLVDEMKKMSEENHRLQENLQTALSRNQIMEAENKLLKDHLNYKDPAIEMEQEM